MYEISDLFDKRSTVGSKLEQLLEERGITKAELYKRTGVSRPTIDKLLMGTLTNKTNYEKHITKILGYLNINADMLLGNMVSNRIRVIRNLSNISFESLGDYTGISLERLKQIESGDQATLAELRDIAICLSISVRVLLGENYFAPQISTLDSFIKFCNDEEEVCGHSGFWGHVGVLPNNSEKYMWYPITRNTRKNIYRTLDNDRMVIPCMNNKVLLLFMQNIKDIVLLDDDCDQPGSINWDNSVSEGEIPLVVYEALEDFYYLEDEGTDCFSEKFLEALKTLIEKRGWSEGDILSLTSLATIYYKDGKTRVVDIDFNQNENISLEITNIYEFGDSEFYEKILYFSDMNGMENMIISNNVSMIEVPFIKIENAICENI